MKSSAFLVLGIVLTLLVKAQQKSLPVTMDKIREQFFAMNQVKNGPLNLYYRLQPLDLSVNPVALAYRGASSAASAGSVEGVYKKLKYFNQGKSELELAVKANPNDPEIRFLRLATQVNAPSFLGYNENIREDKEIVLKALSSWNGSPANAYLYYQFSDFLIQSKILDRKETLVVNTFRNTKR